MKTRMDGECFWGVLVNIFQGSPLSCINIIIFTLIKVHLTQLETEIDVSNLIGQA